MSGTKSDVKRWLRYWRHSLVDAESWQGALSKKALNNTHSLDCEVFRAGHLPEDHPLLDVLFKDEPERKQLVHVVLRPTTHKLRLEHGKAVANGLPEIITPVVCGAWLSREGILIPSQRPIMPRDLLSPQANDHFTLNSVASLDAFLSQEDVGVWEREGQALALLDSITSGSDTSDFWACYYQNARDLFTTLAKGEWLETFYVCEREDRELRIAKTEAQAGAAKHIIQLYDWLTECEDELSLFREYALTSIDRYQPCIAPLQTMALRSAHANRQYPLAAAQRDALSQALFMEQGEILALNGPPGTGKTTFVLSVVASLWTNAALHESEPPVIVAASTNNQAVTNVLEAFAKDFEQTDDLLGQRWLPEVTSYGGYLPAVSKENKASESYQTTSFFRQMERPDQVANAERYFLSMAQQVFDDVTLSDIGKVRVCLHKNLKALHDALEEVTQQWYAYVEACTQREAVLGNTPEEALNRERQALKTLSAELETVQNSRQRWTCFCSKESIWLSLFSMIPIVARKRQLKRQVFIDTQFDTLSRHIVVPGGEYAADPDQCLESWIASRRKAVEQQQTLVAKWAQLEEKYLAAAYRMDTLCQQLDIASSRPASFEALDQALDTSLRFAMFQWATHYWEARWLEDCQAQYAELKQQATTGKEKTGFKATVPRWKRRMKLTPCMVSTFHSLPSHMGYRMFEGEGTYSHHYLTDYIDLLIVDEAGQVAPDVAGASMALAKRALVIGDVHQIKPVSMQLPQVDKGNLDQQSLVNSLEEYDALSESGRLATNGSVMRIAQTASRYRYIRDAEPGMYLREHRRCLTEIISFCNDLCYNGMLLPKRNTPAKASFLPPIGYVHVDGRVASVAGGSRVNDLEAETIAAWLVSERDRLTAAYDGLPLEKIVGIVTPFSAQARLIQQKCKAKGILIDRGTDSMTIGTVHALQGAERPVILFSAVYSRHDDGGFIDMDPALLNVAVSRAKDSFITFGDMDVISAAALGTPRHMLSRYLFAHDRNAIAFAVSVARQDLLATGNTLQVINDAEQHDRWFYDLLARAQRNVIVVSPWITQLALENTALSQSLAQAVARGICITVYTDHYFNTTTNNQPDVRKKQRFEECCDLLNRVGVKVKCVSSVHSKMVMADDHYLCVGSYNWLSAVRQGVYKNMETSVVYQGNLMDEIGLQTVLLDSRVIPDIP